jgi:hypothetical protein
VAAATRERTFDLEADFESEIDEAPVAFAGLPIMLLRPCVARVN